MASVASLVGCIGVIRRNCGILFGSAAFNTFVLLLLFNFIICVCFSHHSIEAKIKEDMKRSLENYNKNISNGYSSPGWDTLQNEYECCGIDHYTDWLNRTDEVTPPYSCALKKLRKNQPIDFLSHLRKNIIPKYIHNLGCLSTIKQNIENHKLKLLLTAGCFELLIIFAITITCYLGKKIRDFDFYYDPLSGHEDYELTRIVRKHQNQKRRYSAGTLKGSRLDRIRVKEDPNQNIEKIASIIQNRPINHTVL